MIKYQQKGGSNLKIWKIKIQKEGIVGEIAEKIRSLLGTWNSLIETDDFLTMFFTIIIWGPLLTIPLLEILILPLMNLIPSVSLKPLFNILVNPLLYLQAIAVISAIYAGIMAIRILVEWYFNIRN
jgi:hypothetical protein